MSSWELTHCGCAGPSEIRRQVEDICHSSAFDGAPRLRELLRYIVERTLAGTPATEPSIAVELYGKDPNTFHPSIDGVARAETRRLRAALKEFYESKQGRNAFIRIAVNKYTAETQFMRPDHSEPSNVLPPKQPKRVEDIYVMRLIPEGRLQLPDALIRWLSEGSQSAPRVFLTNDISFKRMRIYPERTAVDLIRQFKARNDDDDGLDDFSFLPEDEHENFVHVDSNGWIEIPYLMRLHTGLNHAERIFIWRNDYSGVPAYIVAASESHWNAPPLLPG